MIIYFLSGAITLGYLVLALFFLRFWKNAGDRLFFLFALAFGVFALERIIFIYLSPSNEIAPYVYCVRLVGFLIILFAIIDRNRR